MGLSSQYGTPTFYYELFRAGNILILATLHHKFREVFIFIILSIIRYHDRLPNIKTTSDDANFKQR